MSEKNDVASSQKHPVGNWNSRANDLTGLEIFNRKICQPKIYSPLIHLEIESQKTELPLTLTIAGLYENGNAGGKRPD